MSQTGLVMCGAQHADGSTCAAPVVAGRRRCRAHGGLSTGPRTPEGRRRVAAAVSARRKRSSYRHGFEVVAEALAAALPPIVDAEKAPEGAAESK